AADCAGRARTVACGRHLHVCPRRRPSPVSRLPFPTLPQELPMSAPTRVPTHRADGSAVYFRGARIAPKMAAATGGAVMAAGLGGTGAGLDKADAGFWDE